MYIDLIDYPELAYYFEFEPTHGGNIPTLPMVCAISAIRYDMGLTDEERDAFIAEITPCADLWSGNDRCKSVINRLAEKMKIADACYTKARIIAFNREDEIVEHFAPCTVYDTAEYLFMLIVHKYIESGNSYTAWLEDDLAALDIEIEGVLHFVNNS